MTHKDKTGKFGRILGDFKIWDKDKEDYVTFTTVMLDNHHAVKYDGQSKEDIKEAHLKNREWLIKVHGKIGGLNMAFKLSKRSLARLEGVDERMVRVVKTAISVSKIDFGVIKG